MAKARNTPAKRRQETQQKRAAVRKRERSTEKKRAAHAAGKAAQSPSNLSPAEQTVLGVFRNYMMSPGRMLCFGSADLQTYRVPLAGLTAKGLLVAEKFRGGYSLTNEGFAAMRRGA
jgi:hypothetical protein